jgi:glycosyltransferase involved in cell wall biosynthesis
MSDSYWNIASPQVSQKSLQANPSVSVVVPIHNAEKTLATCLDSLCNQTMSDIEIICVDDGSTDRSIEIAQHYAELDRTERNLDRFTVIQQDNQGPAAARNAGLNVARGRFISFVDSDDFMHIEAYEHLLEYEKHHDFDVLVFGGFIIDDNWEDKSIEWIRVKLSPEKRYYAGNEQVLRAVFHEESARPFIWLHFIRRSILENPAPLRFNEGFSIGEDQLFQFSYFLRAENVLFIEKKFYCYRVIGNDGIMSKFYKMPITKLNYHFELVEVLVSDLLNRGLHESLADELIVWATNFLYEDIIPLPLAYRKDYAKRLSAIYDHLALPLYYIPDVHAMERAEHIKRIAEDEVSQDADAYEELNAQIKDLDGKIERALNSKALRAGRLVTRRRKRDLPEESELRQMLKKHIV